MRSKALSFSSCPGVGHILAANPIGALLDEIQSAFGPVLDGMSEANVPKMQELYAAFGRGDIDTILRSVSDDCTWGTDTIAREVPWYGIRTGRAAVGDFFATLAREVEFPRFEPTVFAGVGDQVFVHVDMEYRFRKNGRSASTGSLHEFTLRDGIVTRFRAYEDTAGVRDSWNG